jgi:hypothetical protein
MQAKRHGAKITAALTMDGKRLSWASQQWDQSKAVNGQGIGNGLPKT